LAAGAVPHHVRNAVESLRLDVAEDRHTDVEPAHDPSAIGQPLEIDASSSHITPLMSEWLPPPAGSKPSPMRAGSVVGTSLRQCSFRNSSEKSTSASGPLNVRPASSRWMYPRVANSLGGSAG